MAEKDMVNTAYEAVEVAKATGAIKKGVNEVTKTVEKGTAKLVLYANDVNPKEIVMHLSPLCKEKGVPCVEVGTKEELGAAAGLPLGTAAVSIVKEGEAKNIIKNLSEE
ncbi:MAG: L7Ae/L30e/S12e/Gadd45 family ribosomal protein [Nanobdellota archaeon]